MEIFNTIYLYRQKNVNLYNLGILWDHVPSILAKHIYVGNVVKCSCKAACGETSIRILVSYTMNYTSTSTSERVSNY